LKGGTKGKQPCSESIVSSAALDEKKSRPGEKVKYKRGNMVYLGGVGTHQNSSKQGETGGGGGHEEFLYVVKRAYSLIPLRGPACVCRANQDAAKAFEAPSEGRKVRLRTNEGRARWWKKKGGNRGGSFQNRKGPLTIPSRPTMGGAKKRGGGGDEYEKIWRKGEGTSPYVSYRKNVWTVRVPGGTSSATSCRGGPKEGDRGKFTLIPE